MGLIFIHSIILLTKFEKHFPKQDFYFLPSFYFLNRQYSNKEFWNLIQYISLFFHFDFSIILKLKMIKNVEIDKVVKSNLMDSKVDKVRVCLSSFKLEWDRGHPKYLIIILKIIFFNCFILCYFEYFIANHWFYWNN